MLFFVLSEFNFERSVMWLFAIVTNRRFFFTAFLTPPQTSSSYKGVGEELEGRLLQDLEYALCDCQS